MSAAKTVAWGSVIAFVGLAAAKNWTVREALGNALMGALIVGAALNDDPEVQAQLQELLEKYQPQDNGITKEDQ